VEKLNKFGGLEEWSGGAWRSPFVFPFFKILITLACYLLHHAFLDAPFFILFSLMGHESNYRSFTVYFTLIPYF